jgi:alkylated DNA repair dioxygenase AlkB
MNDLHTWVEVLSLEFKLELDELAVTIERLPGCALGHFRPGHNGFGLRGEIALDEGHVRENSCKDRWHDVIGTLFHEMLHVWQQAYGKPGRGNYHNKEFRDKAAAFGLVIDETGVQTYAADSPFLKLLESKGVQVPAMPESAVPKKPKGPGSKLKLWQCTCPQKIRVGKQTIRILCLDCNTKFQLFEPTETKPPTLKTEPNMMVDTNFRHYQSIDLNDGSQFGVGRLPEHLVWDQPTFDQAWALHPTDRHVVKIITPKITPRWQQAYGANYSYTGSQNNALPIPREFRPLLEWAQAYVDARLNGLLLNWYEGPHDYIGDHHDSTKNLIPGTPIVTVSHGEERTFRLSRGKGAAKQTRDFPAPHGTLFVMPWETNRAWKHAVPKRSSYRGRRISVTLRAFASGILPPETYFAD